MSTRQVSVGLLALVAVLAACSRVPIIEPEDQPPTVWNALDEAVDIYSVAEGQALEFIVTLQPGGSFEWEDPQGRWGCVEEDLAAFVGDREVDRWLSDQHLCFEDTWRVEIEQGSTLDG